MKTFGEFFHKLNNKTKLSLASALVIVLSFSWNDLVKSIIETYSPIKKDQIFFKFLHVIFLTMVVILISDIILNNVKEPDDLELIKKEIEKCAEKRTIENNPKYL